MKVFVDLPHPLSIAMDRVVMALKATAPRYGFEITSNRAMADLVILHVIGRDALEAVEEVKAAGQQYGVIQYCVRTSGADTREWAPFWRGAAVVWSYYRLHDLMREDGLARDMGGFDYYLAPLGADAAVFRPYNVPKRAAIMTSGYVAESESVVEVARAVHALGERMIHLGPQVEIAPNLAGLEGLQIGYTHNVPDGILAQQLSRCRYVSGLRRGEGFELPALEGLLCGARPIFYDRPHYKHWFVGHAEFIPEGSPDEVTAALTSLLAREPAPVSAEERAEIARRFEWGAILGGFWQALARRTGAGQRPALRAVRSPQEPAEPASAPEPGASAGAVPRGTSPAAEAVSRKGASRRTLRRLLLIGDAVVETGFARGTLAYGIGAQRAGWDVHCLGLNYNGDPHDWPFKVYPARAGGDLYGFGRLSEMVAKLSPAACVVQNDPWNLPPYMKRLGTTLPTIAVLAVDGKNMAQARNLNGLAGAIFWTEFGLAQARNGGYTGPAKVIPLGVDRAIYKPQDRAACRRDFLPASYRDFFIVGCANRNHPRKRMDLLLSYFSQWIRTADVQDAALFFHAAPTGDAGYDLRQLAAYHQIANRVIVQEPEIGFGLSEASLAAQYATWDVAMTTTQGEGFGLTTLESMACGIPQILPMWSALGEWAAPGALMVPVSDVSVTPGHINVIGGIMDRNSGVQALDDVYRDEELRADMAKKALSLASEPRFEWPAIQDAFAAALEEFVSGPQGL